MAVNCGVPYGLCAVRVTELDEDGNAEGSFVVTRNPITVGFNPNIDQGQQFVSRNGCGCAIARIRSNDVFNWFELTFGQDMLNPELGVAAERRHADRAGWLDHRRQRQLERSTATTWPRRSRSRCGRSTTSAQGPTASTRTCTGCSRASRWQRGNNTVEEGIARTNLTGFSQTNLLWGIGPVQRRAARRSGRDRVGVLEGRRLPAGGNRLRRARHRHAG